uniref:SSD domain-containing protein n=1 Tax=Panagrolaimus sp. ES5 TaxID=591445 RepID=A0AC34F965_9BILA
MLTLIEKPGKGREANRSRSDLISFGNNEAFDYDYYEAMLQPEPLILNTKLDRFLIGHSNSSHFSAKWKADFELRPTWCDADLSLQQIKRGNATGNKIALYSRSFIQNCLYNLGCMIQRHSIAVILTIMVLFAFCCYGLQYVRIETDIVKLWVSEGGRLDEELHYFEKVQKRYGNETWTLEKDKYLIREDGDPLLKQRPEDENANQGFQVIIQTSNTPDENLLTKDGLKKHVQLLQQLVDIQVDRYGTNWTLSDICFKPGGLDISNDSIAYSMKSMLERLIPCIWITPIDCFYDGSKPVGPNPPIDTSAIQSYASLFVDIPQNTTWGNVNPEEVIKVISDIFDIGTVKDFFLRTGIGAGYLDRPCIDPLDATCPKLAPNYFNACPSMNLFQKHLKTSGKTLDDVLEAEVEEKKAGGDFDFLAALFGGGGDSKSSSGNSTDSLGDGFNDTEVENELLSDKECKKYRKSFLKWIEKHEEEATALFGKANMPQYPDYGKVTKNGCQGFARSVLNWPKDMILGGVREKDDGSIEAEALQSVLLVSSPTDVYKRLRGSEKVLNLKNGNKTYSYNASNEWSPNMADEIIAEWQRRFTQSIYNHELNFRVESDGSRVVQRVVHPLASTSISDMLAEFCDFNYTVILFGYILMLVYAVYSQMHCDSFLVLGVNSTAGLAIAGVLCVTFASVSGLGLATWFGIEFNAATTQIVPFLTLGVGVDSIFLLLHNYPLVASNPKLSELGLLMKETGMSILITSLNNIFSFLAGAFLPIPALRAFCLQTTILLTFNLISIMTIYPALIAIDLRRKRANRRDLFCCFTAEDEEDELPRFQKESQITPYGVILDKQASYHGLLSTTKDEEDFEDEGLVYGRLHSFLRNYYIPFVLSSWAKWLIIGLSLCLFGAGIVGLKYSTMGLDLSDVLPDHTAPAAFLKARDKYFSFYPMAVILRGDNLDFAHKQHLVRNLRRDIGESKFIVKLETGEPSERYWLGLFQDWLQGLQLKLNEAQKHGMLTNFDSHTNTSNELRIAVSMICSYGENYDCSRLTKGVKLIDESGTINEEGFYNYLYAWHEYENMFYTVSQANFYPKLHKLRQGPPENRYRHYIPPAPQPVYSSIPFYLTGLKETVGIVEMIEEIREICDRYTDAGLDNYPSGIAFTFWEQYLDLNEHLVIAIALVTFAVFCVISILLFNPWAAGCITIILIMMTVELAGFLGWCGIKLNPVSAVSLITAVGIGVEFTAHVVLAFLTSLGSRDDRMSACIDRVFVPVIHGALSTLLGIMMLGFSEFEFVFKYFFVIMFALIIIGLINGLAILPVFLSMFGPPCEIKPIDGSNRLAVPPALKRQRKK